MQFKLQTKKQKMAEVMIREQLFKERKSDSNFGYNSLIVSQCGILDRWIKNIIGENDIKNKNILELGSESGHLSLEVLNQFNPQMVVASDLSNSLSDAVSFFASRMNYKLLPKICIIDNIAIPFKNESFDIVFSCNCLHHLPNPLLCIEEVRRVLKKRGIFLLILEPFYPRYLFFLKFLFSNEHKRKGLCENIFSLKKWLNFLFGFEIVKIEFYPPQRLAKILPSWPNLFKNCTGGWFSLLARIK